MTTRPNIEDIKTGAELIRWYWLKEELVAYCKSAGINYTGVKFDILERIARFLDNKPVRKEQKANGDSERQSIQPIFA